MRMPEFSAEASLYRTTEIYPGPNTGNSPESNAVAPQQTFSGIGLRFPVRNLPPPRRDCDRERGICLRLWLPRCLARCPITVDWCPEVCISRCEINYYRCVRAGGFP